MSRSTDPIDPRPGEKKCLTDRPHQGRGTCRTRARSFLSRACPPDVQGWPREGGSRGRDPASVRSNRGCFKAKQKISAQVTNDAT